MVAYHLIDGVGDAEYTGCHKDGPSEEENEGLHAHAALLFLLQISLVV